MKIYHGSENIIYSPAYGLGNHANDYGRGFYCTGNYDIAGEWACKRDRDGFINHYELNTAGLKICNLNDDKYNILNWLAILTRYRGYWQRASIAEDAKEYLQENFLIDISGYDIIIGYRADDSYFSFAQDFIMGTISLRRLSTAMHLGKLGEQIVLKSEKAFEHISFLASDPADAEKYYPRKVSRDKEARAAYGSVRSSKDRKDDIYMLDIMRGGLSDEDLRI